MPQKAYNMKLKVDEAGHVVLTDGKPTYVDEAGKDFVIDGATLYNRVRELTTENTNHRKAREDAETALKAFEGIEDAEAARAAIQTVADLGSGELTSAAQLAEFRKAAEMAAEEKVRATATQSAAQIRSLSENVEKLTTSLRNEKIGGNFGRSKFMAEKVAAPTDMMQAMFGDKFKIEDDKVVGYDHTGSKIYSRNRLDGSLADFDEALEIMVESYAHKNSILRGDVKEGGGATQGTTANGGKTVTRAAFEKMAPAMQAAAGKEAFEGKLTITD